MIKFRRQTRNSAKKIIRLVVLLQLQPENDWSNLLYHVSHGARNVKWKPKLKLVNNLQTKVYFSLFYVYSYFGLLLYVSCAVNKISIINIAAQYVVLPYIKEIGMKKKVNDLQKWNKKSMDLKNSIYTNKNTNKILIISYFISYRK